MVTDWNRNLKKKMFFENWDFYQNWKKVTKIPLGMVPNLPLRTHTKNHWQWCPYSGVWKYYARLVRPGPISFRTSSKFLFTCPGTSIKKDHAILYFIFWLIIMNSQWQCMEILENSVDPDQLDLHCFRLSLYLVSYCFKEFMYGYQQSI